MKNALDMTTPTLAPLAAAWTLVAAALAGCSPDAPPAHGLSRAGDALAPAGALHDGLSQALPAALRATYIALVQANAPAAFDGDTAVAAGAPSDDDHGNASGSADVFTSVLANGDPCTSDAECTSGFCVDGVCCDAACGGSDATDCQACSTAAGAAVDGTCGSLAMGTTCRPAIGSCDVAEVCSGTSAACPADAVAPADTECRGSGGDCDVAETCDGTSKMCPANTVVAAGTECRPADGLCDVAEMCDGSNLNCPADAPAPAGTECRAAAPVCDVAETCDGIKFDCPPNVFKPDNSPCPAGTCNAGGVCLLAGAPTEDAGGCGCRVAGEAVESSERSNAPGPARLWGLALAVLMAGVRRRRAR